jgi:hypothetical protein
MEIIYIAFIFIIIGFIILYIDQYYRYQYKKPKEKIIYKYIPRTPIEELEEPVFPSDIFETMFSQPDPWILELNDLDTRQRNKINQYYISAI